MTFAQQIAPRRSAIEAPLGLPRSSRHRLPRAEDCGRLTTGQLRGDVTQGAEQHQLTDGTKLQLRWQPVRGCFGGRGGWALMLACPLCSRTARVLWRPPHGDWGCWHCNPVSHRSHRRSGSQAGRRKPRSWRLDQITAAQDRAAKLLALQHWPPQRLMWSWLDLLEAPTHPDAPRLTSSRRQALAQRICALETLRLDLLLPIICAQLKSMGQELVPCCPQSGNVSTAHQVLIETAWAVRRPGGDPRTTRGGVRRKHAVNAPRGQSQ